MTLRQKKFLEELPKNGNCILKAARKAGYSESYAKGELYKDLRRPENRIHQTEYFNEKSVKRDIKKAKKLCLKKEDITNFLRATELESKILGLQVDKSEITNKNPDKCIVVYGNKATSTENVT